MWLAYSEAHDFSLIRLNGHKVICNDSHRVLINAELLDTFGPSVDQSQPVLVSRRELEFGKTSIVRARRSISDERAIVIHLAIDQIVDGFRRYHGEIRTHHLLYEVIILLMIIVRQQNWTDIDVVVCAIRSVDYQRSKNTTGILCTVVRMVPSRAIQVRFEIVC